MKLTGEDVQHRFTNHPPSSDSVETAMDDVTYKMIGLANFLAVTLPESREASLAITHLEQASMWSKAAIARNQKDIV
jgi:hypothetical protein